MENENFIKQAKSDIFKEMQPIINFYIKKGAKPQSLRKYYKNSKRFEDLLEDIKNKGINLVKDEEEYKKLVREVLNDILDDHINKEKDEEYKNKFHKMKHIKEFNSFNPINEGADWILLQSINKEMDSYNFNFLEPRNELLGDTIEYETEEWYDLYNQLDDIDKDTVDSCISSN